jgi:hypothetical protein
MRHERCWDERRAKTKTLTSCASGPMTGTRDHTKTANKIDLERCRKQWEDGMLDHLDHTRELHRTRQNEATPLYDGGPVVVDEPLQQSSDQDTILRSRAEEHRVIQDRSGEPVAEEKQFMSFPVGVHRNRKEKIYQNSLNLWQKRGCSTECIKHQSRLIYICGRVDDGGCGTCRYRIRSSRYSTREREEHSFPNRFRLLANRILFGTDHIENNGTL